jgi:hypothetical protein
LKKTRDEHHDEINTKSTANSEKVEQKSLFECSVADLDILCAELCDSEPMDIEPGQNFDIRASHDSRSRKNGRAN